MEEGRRQAIFACCALIRKPVKLPCHAFCVRKYAKCRPGIGRILGGRDPDGDSGPFELSAGVDAFGADGHEDDPDIGGEEGGRRRLDVYALVVLFEEVDEGTDAGCLLEGLGKGSEGLIPQKRRSPEKNGSDGVILAIFPEGGDKKPFGMAGRSKGGRKIGLCRRELGRGGA